MTLNIDDLKKAKNIAELLDEQKLAEIGAKVMVNFDIDYKSCREWNDRVDKAMDIAKQTMEVKNHPFHRASNVKYPLITKLSIDTAARLYPMVVQNERVVKATIIGKDSDGEKLKRSVRISKHMSYQVLHQMGDFETDTDSLLHILPIVGTMFKKIYYDPILGKPISELCNPDRIVVNYNTQSLEKASRISHLLIFYANDVIERMRSGLFLDVDLELLKSTEEQDSNEDTDSPLELIEQHCFLDLDGDGYQEPYIVTCHKESKKVLRIVQRFKAVHKNDKGQVQRIEPQHYFTDYHFIRSPDGGFYSVGLGSLLYPLNSAINTLINQLIDAGTLNNMQSGFLGKGLRLRGGEFKFKLGEWKILDSASGLNLQQNIMPLPTKEPSQTLFQLLGFLVEVGEDLISTNDLMQGKGQTQNVATSTVDAMIEQGMKVFNSIAKRLYRSLRGEFSKIYELNRKHLTQKDYARVLDEDADVKADYAADDLDILPVADPSMSSQTQKLMIARSLMAIETLDPYEKTKYYLEAMQLDEQVIDRLLPKPDPNAPPPPEAQKTMAEVEKIAAESKLRMAEISKISIDAQLEEEKIKIAQQEAASRSSESAARVVKMNQDSVVNQAKVDLASGKSMHEAEMKEFDLLHKREKDEVELSIKTVEVAASLEKAKKEVSKSKEEKK